MEINEIDKALSEIKGNMREFRGEIKGFKIGGGLGLTAIIFLLGVIVSLIIYVWQQQNTKLDNHQMIIEHLQVNEENLRIDVEHLKDDVYLIKTIKQIK